MNKRQRVKNARKYLELIREARVLYPHPQYFKDGFEWNYVVKTAKKRRIDNSIKNKLYEIMSNELSNCRAKYRIN